MCSHQTVHCPCQQAWHVPHQTISLSAVLTVHNNIVSAIDKGYVVALALLDLSSAFDTVDHTLLLSILENRFSVTRTSLERFRSYLTDRTQIFTAGLTSTSPLPLVFGIPQDSGLGPVEFIAYTETTTDIFSNHHILYHLFADYQHFVDLTTSGFRKQSCLMSKNKAQDIHILCPIVPSSQSSRSPPWCTPFLISMGQHTSTTSNSTEKNLDIASSIPLQPTQLSWGQGPSLGSAPSPSAVQVSGTRFLPTPGTFILLWLFTKL